MKIYLYIQKVIAFLVLSGLFVSSAMATNICATLHYNYLDQVKLGGPCMPDSHKKSGFRNEKLCQRIYYCVLKQSYSMWVSNAHKVVNHPDDSDKPYHFKPSKNISFVSFDVGLNDANSPINCKGDFCHTNNLIWVTQKAQLKQRLCSNPTFKRQKNNSDFIGLYMHQLLGMPPLAASSDNGKHPYRIKGLYVISFKPGEASLNPTDQNQLYILNHEIGGMPALVASPGYQINKTTASVIRLCRSGNGLSLKQCIDKNSSAVPTVSAYKTWVAQWVRLVYPLNIIDRDAPADKAVCEVGGKAVSCLAQYQFFPWTSMGDTENWSTYSYQKPLHALHTGLYEYGIPQGVYIPKKDIRFVPIQHMVHQLCSS